MDFKAIVVTLAAETSLTAQQIVEVANALAEADGNLNPATSEGRRAIVLSDPEVMGQIESGQRVLAIKTLCAKHEMNLKHAADAVRNVEDNRV